MPTGIIATLGVSIETIDIVQAQIATLPVHQAGTQTEGVDPANIAERIARHLLNHLSSFEVSVGPQTMVPIGVIQRWYENLQGKLKAGGISVLMKGD